MTPHENAHGAVGKPCDLVGSDALTCPIALWAELPVPSAVRCLDGSGRVVWLCAARRIAQDARGRGEVVFGPLEYQALALGLAEGRADGQEVAAWCARKRQSPGWVLGAGVAVAGAVGLLDGGGRVAASALGGRTMGWLVQAMGLRFDGVESVEREGVAVAARAEEVALAAL